MGRPPKRTDDLQAHTLRFTVTTADYISIQQAAAQASKNLSDYLRERTLNGHTVVNQTRALDPELFDQLRRIGVNLNQAVRFVHTFSEVPPELLSAARAVEAFLTDHLTDDRHRHG